MEEMINPSRCTIKTKKCDIKNWERLNGKKVMPPCCVKHLRDTIFYASNLFEEHGIKYWIDFGTLLGAVREGRTIPHDTDGDFGLLFEDREKVLKLENQIYNDGFFLQKHFYTDHHMLKIHGKTVLRLCRSYTNRNQIDLFFWVNDNHTLNSDGLNVDKSFPDWFIVKRQPVLLYNKEIMAPRDPEKFLEFRYGKDWTIPQNKKVHFKKAIETHKPAFDYAKKRGWPVTIKYL